MRTIEELNEKIWYRTLKVVFLFCFISVVLIIVILLCLSSWPQKTIDWDKTSLICNNGKIYAAKTGDSFLWGIGGSESIGAWDNAKIKKICEYNVIDSFPLSEENYKIPEWDNYKIKWEYVWQPSVIDFISIVLNRMFWGAVIFYVLVFEFLLKIFYYIVFGTSNPRKDDN